MKGLQDHAKIAGPEVEFVIEQLGGGGHGQRDVATDVGLGEDEGGRVQKEEEKEKEEGRGRGGGGGGGGRKWMPTDSRRP